MTDAIVHLSGELLILELEPRQMPIAENAMAQVQGMVRNVQRSDSLPALYQAIATEVRDVTGFDRVMVYRFDPDGSGAVIAEARGPGIDSFLGLHFPASDIPRQVRLLYLANWIRNIPDARYAPAVIVPPLNPLTGQPLDLSQSVLRSVSPVHRQYLANMGVVASISLSLILRGQLWGLIACHHNAPRYLPHSLREVCELFAEMTSSYLNMRLIEADLEAQLHKARIHEELVRQISLQPDLNDGLIRNASNPAGPDPGGRSRALGRRTAQCDRDDAGRGRGRSAGELAECDSRRWYLPHRLPARVYGRPLKASPTLPPAYSPCPCQGCRATMSCGFARRLSRTVSWAGNPGKTGRCRRRSRKPDAS